MARPGLTTHRKFRRLARALGSAIVARGVLELMWESAYEAGEDYIGTADDLAATVGWTEAPETLARALADAGQPESQGFIDPITTAEGKPQQYRIHDLWHHAPDYVKKRREREMDRRRRTAPDGAETGRHLDSQSGVDRTPSPAPSHAPSPAPAPVQNMFGETAPPPLLVFPTIGKEGDRWPLTTEFVDELSSLFPGVDVLAEGRKALAWVTADGKRRKTFGGMRRFISGWLTRGVNRGTAARLPERAAPMEPEVDWFAECQRLHHGECGGSLKHRNRMLIDAEKARRYA